MKVEIAPSFLDSLKRIGAFGSKIRSICSWFHYHFKKDFFKLLGVVLKSYPWDYSFLYYMEKAKIEEMRKYHERNRLFVGVEHVIRDMKICENLIDIFTDKRPLFHFNGDVNIVKSENGNYKFEESPNFGYVCDVKVNTRNADRFLPQGLSEKAKQYWLDHPDEIYKLKARYLYHKIRLERDETWWD